MYEVLPIEMLPILGHMSGHIGISFLVELSKCRFTNDRIPSTTPGAEPPGDAKDSGSARPHSTHLETSSTNRP